ncbi:hypothetical protein SISNIDRAFT_483344 [Sistotremastrum niveocremeum HHB9708]|uniref:Copper transport protein n=1 Tax=Sistotremastrum niveocremeum HHB9708 TaxID=1314777 RepID=A0A164XFI2_9AGAM|nr:hypothetical protein SISNIDRAFT_483344 [Sistotremastrum niveocremeum HHB9708]
MSIALLPLLFLGVAAQMDPDMSSDGMDDMGGMTSGGMMMPWMHFSLGDSLWFSAWVPQSKGALAGACIGLFMLAIIERWLAAMRGVMEAYWRRRAIVAARIAGISNAATSVNEKESQTEIESLPKLNNATRPAEGRIAALRTMAPFIPAHDIARGIIHAAQAALGYALMLAVMTFQAGFLISIVVGLGVGEIIFGRYAALAAHLH